jgi:EAL domain-containing protein (putative c-di-GMP-specific phosphodiesterase class I)
LNFQPKIDLKTKKILGAEALVRWVSDGKIIPPDEFIPVAEDAGFIDELGIFVLKEALKSIKIIQKEVPLKLNISINVSRLQMRNADFASRIKKEVTEYGVSFSDIILEITESALISSRETTSKIMNMLDEAGVKFSIDDFGTGITSISYIRDFPFNEIKIDKSFIKNIVGNKISQGIVKSIVALGSNLNIDVVAEGVEDEVTLKYLEDIGCDIAQGYFISKPLSLDDFIKFCNKNLMKFKVE